MAFLVAFYEYIRGIINQRTTTGRNSPPNANGRPHFVSCSIQPLAGTSKRKGVQMTAVKCIEPFEEPQDKFRAQNRATQSHAASEIVCPMMCVVPARRGAVHIHQRPNRFIGIVTPGRCVSGAMCSIHHIATLTRTSSQTDQQMSLRRRM